jgi:hypothetical protein
MRWTPVAAAAGVAVLAFGVLRWLPADKELRQPAPVAFPASDAGRAPDTAARESVSPAQRRDSAPLVDERTADSTTSSLSRSPAESSAGDLQAESAAAKRREAPSAVTSPGVGSIEPSPPAVEPPAAPAPASTASAPASASSPPPEAAENDAAEVANESRARVDTAASPSAGASATESGNAISVTGARATAQQKAVEQDWERRITSLYDAGRLDDAANALREFRKLDPHADQRLPEKLRAWSATVRD